jgi:Uma2 family endonuclease
MTTAAQRRGYYTFEDLADTPDDQRYEVIEGVLVVTPPPSGIHQRIVGRLLRQLEDAASSGWLALAGVAVSGGPDSPIPDISVVRVLDPLPNAWQPTDVLLVVGVVSPGRRRFDTVTKRDTYARLGIPFYWVVDPTTTPQRLVEIDLATLEVIAEGEHELTVERPFPITVRL